jgi:hypothetical protein
MSGRPCSRSACGAPAVATITYSYRDSLVVMGPLATESAPEAYDLCQRHASLLKVPGGWQLMRYRADLNPMHTEAGNAVAAY